jgi:hypothetical protein
MKPTKISETILDILENGRDQSAGMLTQTLTEPKNPLLSQKRSTNSLNRAIRRKRTPMKSALRAVRRAQSTVAGRGVFCIGDPRKAFLKHDP